MKKIFWLLYLLSPLTLLSAPYHGKIVPFRQPDGSFVNVKLFGDEYYARAESLDGYTLVRDKTTQWLCYAKLSEDGNALVPTQVKYTGTVNDPGISGTEITLPKHLDISGKALQKIVAANKVKLGNPLLADSKSPQASPPVIGNIKGLCLVVDFSDVPGTLPISEFSSFCNDMNYSNFGNNGSLRTYYSDVSGNLVDYENIVYGYYRAPLTFWEYDQMPYAQGAKIILGQALNWVASLGFDFSTLSINPDNSIQAINLMYTGYPLNWAEGMWWHMGSYTGFSANGVHSKAYNCSPANDPLELSVVAHENGHMIGKWPDTYKYNSNTGPDGIGSFDLMCWYGSYNNPVPPNPFFRSDAGWKNVVDVTYFNGWVSDTANSLNCYKFRNVNDTNEFYIMESRSQTGRSADIPDEGLTIWHIDRMGDNQTWHHQVYLEHANNDINDHSQACFHDGFNNEFSHSTTPGSDFYNNDPSGLKVWEIGPVNPVMVYKIGAGQAAPSLVLSYLSITNDNNGNGFLEPGEQGDVNLNASNFGQINSSNVTISCQAIGSSSSFITLITQSVNIGVLAISQTLPVPITVSIAGNTPLGTVIDVVFTISDGTYSSFITKHLIIGQQIIMNDGQVSNCNALFLDPGGIFGNYSDNTEYTLTLLPSVPGEYIQVDFQEFDLEDATNCIYDYLNIYNGINITSPLIGMYCGTNSPGIVNSTDPSGALTFEFHADEGVTGEGWIATVSCTPFSGIAQVNTPENIMVIPNPTTGLAELLLPSPGAGEAIIYDLTGRIIYRCSLKGKQNVTIDISDRPEGVYLLRVINDSHIMNNKILLQK